jgi:hypothetical protein
MHSPAPPHRVHALHARHILSYKPRHLIPRNAPLAISLALHSGPSSGREHVEFLLGWRGGRFIRRDILPFLERGTRPLAARLLYLGWRFRRVLDRGLAEAGRQDSLDRAGPGSRLSRRRADHLGRRIRNIRGRLEILRPKRQGARRYLLAADLALVLLCRARLQPLQEIRVLLPQLLKLGDRILVVAQGVSQVARAIRWTPPVSMHTYPFRLRGDALRGRQPVILFLVVRAETGVATTPVSRSPNRRGSDRQTGTIVFAGEVRHLGTCSAPARLLQVLLGWCLCETLAFCPPVLV